MTQIKICFKLFEFNMYEKLMAGKTDCFDVREIDSGHPVSSIGGSNLTKCLLLLHFVDRKFDWKVIKLRKKMSFFPYCVLVLI